MLLDVKDLSVARGGVTVLEGISFRLEAGQVLVLRGPNGIGKTTLLRTLAGLQPPVAGEISGEEIAYAGHADGVKAGLSVAENLKFWAEINGMDGVGAAMTRMNLSALSGRRACDLSAGQKRRLALARLLVSGRALWLLDEPMVSLDAESTALFGTVLLEHLAQGGAALVASHVKLGLSEAKSLDLTLFRSMHSLGGAFDAALA